MKSKNIIMLTLMAGACLPVMAQYDIIDSVSFKSQQVNVGANRDFTREQSSAAVSVITNKDVNHRGASNIGNNIIGQGNGLVSLQGAGLYHVANPTFYVRGLQSLSTSSPLILVDGVERSITNVVAEDVESVSILKDAAATALYGYKGINGAILVTTKHGRYNTKTIRFSYDHNFSYLTDKPKFVDAYTYGSAVNEALRNEGSATMAYSDAVLQSYKDGTNPLYFPNVNWMDETFRNISHTNKFNLEFTGGTRNFRYFTNVNLVTDKGFIKNFDYNDGYSTQDKYTRATLRSNMDIDLTPKTQLHTHLFGVLTERSQPGSKADLWNMVYTVPANAFPVTAADGVWGGNGTYSTSNPVAQSAGAAYYKTHERALYADMVLNQDLSAITDGLSFQAQIGYDTWSQVYEDHSRTYRYGSYTVSGYSGGIVDPANATLTIDGSDSQMGTGSGNEYWVRHFIFNAALNYDKSFGKHALYSQLKWDWDYSDNTGVNTTVYRQNFTSWTHYGYDDRYLLDLALVVSGSSRLAPATKWAFAPTLSASWNLHKEQFMQSVGWVDFLKLRASVGQLQTDILPGDNIWTYYEQFYTMAGVTYPFYSYGSGFGNTYIAQAKTVNPSREKTMKYNVGLDATLFGGLNLSFDYYIQHRYDSWVSTAGRYTSVFGLTTPYENLGVVDSHGFEVSADYSKQVGHWAFNVGGTLNLNKNTIQEQAEEPRLYSNLVRTGLPLSQLFGYQALGFFQQSDDQNGDGIITEAEMTALGYPVQTFTTVRPGDVRYADVNDDHRIDANDVAAIGHNTVCPELYYTFHLGTEWKRLGITAHFQGVGRYSGVMNTNGMYRSAVSTNTLSQYLYDNSWSAERGNTTTALFPRLSTTVNANNDQTSTLNLFDRSYFKLRSVELYYHLPQSLLKSTGFISQAKVYVRGVDLFTSDHLQQGSAESYGAVMPLTRSVQVGASLTF